MAGLARYFFVVSLLLGIAFGAAPASAQFQPGQEIEYKTGSATWERGVIVHETPGGRQFVIRQKPSQFFPDGSQRAYSLDELRVPQAAAAPAPPPPPTVRPNAPLVTGAGLLSENDVLAYARQVMGPTPFGDPAHRERALAQIRDHIKQRGVNFSTNQAFEHRMQAQDTASVHNSYAIQANYGLAPQLADYFGTFDLTSANRGSTSTKPRTSTTVTKTRIDSQARLGGLTINPDRTYVWDTQGNGREILRGAWREVAPAEMQAWDGGPALWLDNGRQGHTYMVRMNRTPGWEADTWIDVGTGRGRQSIQYGLKQ